MTDTRSTEDYWP